MKDQYPLYAVSVRDVSVGGNLWIIAPSPERAAIEARKLLRRKGYRNPNITEIKSHGTMDVIPAIKSRYHNL